MTLCRSRMCSDVLYSDVLYMPGWSVHSGTVAPPSPSNRASGRAFVIWAAAFFSAAAVIAVVNTTAPITRGWWLVAYLALVGGMSQILLGSGLIALARRSDAGIMGLRHERAELVLWNAGVVIVAVADLVAAPGGVLAGSVLLIAALVLFAGGLRDAVATTRRPALVWVRMYAFLLGFLAVSVIVGTVLAYRGTT